MLARFSSSKPSLISASSARLVSSSRPSLILSARSFASSKPRVGVTFDIDGVLVRGGELLPHATESLRRLEEAGIPFVLLTNGGGEPEPVKAKKLSEALGHRIDEKQVVLSHSPLRPFVHQHRNDKILVLGCRDVVGVARHYGAKRVHSFQDILHQEPTRFPFLHFDHKPWPGGQEDFDEEFAAVFVLHDPSLWGPELTVAIDVIRGGRPLGSGNKGQTIPVYFANPDLIFAGSHPVPRLACGAFNYCLQSLFKEVTGHDLKVTQCGKPTPLTMAFAAKTLKRWRDNEHSEDDDEDPMRFNASAHFDRLFHIGDNPAADIRGALNAGRPWEGILVRTGVFKDGVNDTKHPAHHVVHGVKEAIDTVLKTAEGRVS